MRKHHRLIALAVLTALVLSIASVALADPMLSIKARQAVVTYPLGTKIEARAWDSAEPTKVAMWLWAKPVGASNWAKLAWIPAPRSVAGTISVPTGTLSRTTAFKLTSKSPVLESEVVTVGVKAALSKPVVRARVNVSKRPHWVTVKGFIKPRHAVGSRPVAVKIWWKASATDAEWVYKGTVYPKIVRQGWTWKAQKHYEDRYGSKWQFTRKIDASRAGLWRLQVSHEDTEHVASMSKYAYIRVK